MPLRLSRLDPHWPFAAIGRMFGGMTDAAAWIKAKSEKSLDPGKVETALRQIAANWPATGPPLREVVEQFPLGESVLMHLLAASSVCATRLQRNPETLLWLAQPDVSLSQRAIAQMAGELKKVAGDSVAADNFRLLRLWKGREMLRVSLREVANVAPLEETTAELSQIAEICIRQVARHWNEQLRRKFGSPNARFSVLGLGKLGGNELNHSSDVDLIFLYGDEGQLSPRLSYQDRK